MYLVPTGGETDFNSDISKGYFSPARRAQRAFDSAELLRAKNYRRSNTGLPIPAHEGRPEVTSPHLIANKRKRAKAYKAAATSGAIVGRPQATAYSAVNPFTGR